MSREPELLGATHEVVEPAAAPRGREPGSRADAALAEGLAREGGGAFRARVAAFGEALGSARVLALGREANRHPPELRTHDRFGHRIDEVAFHPAWHEVMRLAMAASVHNLPWREPRPGAQVARSALLLPARAGRGGLLLPAHHDVRLRAGAAPPEGGRRGLAAALLGTEYDPRLVPLAEKRSALVGMAMTEKQGGSDVRANTTRATPVAAGGPGAEYLLVGHKWFCSAPMCDAFLTLAQTGRGLSCFLVPRVRDGRHAQPLRDPAPEGQARQPQQRVERGRVPRHLRAHARRGGARRAHHPRDGPPHAPRLRDRRAPA